MATSKRKSLPAIDYWQDEETVLGEIKSAPANSLTLAMRLSWDSDRIVKCLERLKDKGKACKQNGKWTNRVVQLELFDESSSSPPEQQWKVGDRVCHCKDPEPGTVVKILSESTRVKVLWDCGGESFIESRNLRLVQAIQTVEPTNLPQNKEDGRRPNCGSGYISMRATNVKRNAAKEKPPNYCYYWHYSFSRNFKEVKKTVYLKNVQVPIVRALIAKKTPYQEILKWLKRI